MVVTAVLSDTVLREKQTYEAIDEELQLVRSSKTACLWVDCFIYPVLLVHMFVRAEREGSYVLHMYCLTRMVQYLSALLPLGSVGH